VIMVKRKKMKNIEAFCLAFNIEKNEYPYEKAFKNLSRFCDRIIVLILPSEDNTAGILKSMENKYELVRIYEFDLEEKNADEYIRKGKDLARQCCHKGWVYLTDLDELLTPEAIKIIKKIKPRDKENFWFPFINMCGKNKVNDKSYHDIVPRLFWNDENAEVVGDGFGAVNYKSNNCVLLNAPILHYGFTSASKWREKKKLYGQEYKGIPLHEVRKYIPRKIDTPDNIFIEMKVEDTKEAYKFLMRDIMKTLGRAISNQFKGEYLK